MSARAGILLLLKLFVNSMLKEDRPLLKDPKQFIVVSLNQEMRLLPMQLLKSGLHAIQSGRFCLTIKSRFGKLQRAIFLLNAKISPMLLCALYVDQRMLSRSLLSVDTETKTAGESVLRKKRPPQKCPTSKRQRCRHPMRVQLVKLLIE